MNKSGFTLIELLAVIAILALLALLSSTAITKIVKDSKEDLSSIQISSIESAAKTWGAENLDLMPDSGECGYLSLKDLKEYGLLDSSIIDSKTSKEFLDDLKIKITSTTSKDGKPIIKYEVNPESIINCEEIYWVTDEEYFTVVNNDTGVTIKEYDAESGGTDVRIPTTIKGKLVTEIGRDAFASKNLTNVTIPNGVKIINTSAFAGNQLETLIIPSSVKEIGTFAFLGNKLKSVTIKNGVENIKGAAFVENNLTTIDIPDSVKEIGAGAFADNNLVTVQIGSSISVIYNKAFGNEVGSSHAIVSVKINASKSDVTIDNSEPVFAWASGYSDNDIQWKQ